MKEISIKKKKEGLYEIYPAKKAVLNNRKTLRKAIGKIFQLLFCFERSYGMDIDYESEHEFIIIFLENEKVHIRSLSDGAFQIAYQTLRENQKVVILNVFRKLDENDLKTICEN